MSSATVDAPAIPAQVGRSHVLRRALVPPSLLDLQGPWIGELVLPQRLCWSLPDRERRFDLSDPDQVTAAYRHVIDAARTPADLATYLNGWLLAAVWGRQLTGPVTRARWEAKHEQLRHRTADAAA